MPTCTKIETFREILPCVGNLYLWEYDAELSLQSSTCTEAELLDRVLLSPEKDEILHLLSESCMPLLLSDFCELLWIVSAENGIFKSIAVSTASEQKVEINDPAAAGAADAASPVDPDRCPGIYLLGPVSFSAMNLDRMHEKLERKVHSVEGMRRMLQQFSVLPLMSHVNFLQFGSMLHFCLNEAYVKLSDFRIVRTSDSYDPTVIIDIDRAYKEAEPSQPVSREFESVLLRMVEEGNLHYKDLMTGIDVGKIGTMAFGDSLRQFQDEIIVATALCSRAAVRGGLSYETAMALSDLYIQSVERASTFAEIADINAKMQDDYVNRVYSLKHSDTISPEVRACLDYIDLNFQSAITVKSVMEHTGYAGYYCSTLFKKEMNMTLSQYIQKKRIDYAERLLTDTDKTVGEIAQDLHFSSSSHFISAFKKQTGTTPTQYRTDKR